MKVDTIGPVYLTSEQTKQIKEKGFNERCEGHLVIKTGGVGKGEQFVRRGRLDYDDIYLSYVEENIPEQWQAAEWLRVNHNIDLQPICNYGRLGRTYRMGVIFINKKGEVDTIFLRPVDTPFQYIEFNTPQEAISQAFDYVFKNLI